MDAALIISSGKTGREKALEPLREAGGLTAEQRLVLSFQKAGLLKIYVISHTKNAELEKSLARLGVSFLHNPDPEAEMLDNIRLGFRELPEHCSRVLVTPNTVACCGSETVRRLLASDADLAAAACDGKMGHPILISKKLWPAIMAYRGEGGLRAALKEIGLLPEKVETGDPGVLLSLDADEERVAKLLAKHELKQLRPVLRVALAKEQVFFGPGPQQLLEMVEESQNFREACGKMGISYSKGWKMIEKAEEALGYTLVERSKGGSERGSSKLSPEGVRLLELYRLFRLRTEEAAAEIFREIF